MTIAEGRALYRDSHTSTTPGDGRTLTFADVAGNRLNEGRAQYRSEHGDEASRQALNDVRAGYAAINGGDT